MRKFSIVPMFTEMQIAQRVDQVADDIAKDFKGQDLIMIGLLTGSFIFLADLMRAIHAHGLILQVDFMTVSSYGAATESSGIVKMLKDIHINVRDRPVLLVDDILDSGRTLQYTTTELLKKGPSLIKTCVLLDKPERRIMPVHADYVGFEVPDTFVVGYGLDYDGRYREVPAISRVEFHEE
ncbi:hypoxanthine phosphoribosyltransferase [bacterium]|nr:hypoxanthine phosphoribosyltransferase [bacterium]